MSSLRRYSSLSVRDAMSSAVPALPLAALLAAFATIARRIVWDDWLGARPDDTFLQPLGVLDVVIWLLLTLSLTAILTVLPIVGRVVARFGLLFRADRSRPRPRVWWWPLWSVGIFVSWVPYLLLLWPGVIVPDSFASIGPMIGERALENHHPVAFTLFVGAFIRVGELLGLSLATSLAMFSITQMAIMATCLGWACYWLTTRTPSTALTASLVASFFAFTPVYAIYAVNVQKDPLFSVAVLVLALHIAEIAIRGARPLRQPWFVFRIALLALWVSVWRNGGSLVVAATLLVVLVVWRKAAWKAVVAGALAVVVATGGIAALEASGVKPAPSAEQLAIPLQQVARVIYEGGSLSEAEADVLNRILPVEQWATLYTPARVDAVKWSPQFNDDYLDENRGAFLQAWASVGVRNLDDYVEAWILETFGFWAPGVKNDYGFIDTAVTENPFGIERAPRVDAIFGVDDEDLSASVDFLGSGTLAWILLISCFAVLRSPGRRAAVGFVPLVLLWLAGLAATPTAFSLRYVFAIAVALPFLLLAPALGQHGIAAERPSADED